MKENKEFEAITKFTVRDFAEFETGRGCAFRGTLFRDGVRIGDFENNGQGGCTNFYYTTADAKEEFRTLAKKLFPDQYESEDALVQVLCNIVELKKYQAEKLRQSYTFSMAYFAWIQKGFYTTKMVAPTLKEIEKQFDKDKADDAIILCSENVSFYGDFTTIYNIEHIS